MSANCLFYVTIYSAIFSLIFWIVVFFFKFFYSNDVELFKLNFYECGFTGVVALKAQNNINLTLAWLFLIVYDAEVILLTPFCLTFFESIYSIHTHIIFSVFIIFYILTLLYDYTYSVLEWQV